MKRWPLGHRAPPATCGWGDPQVKPLDLRPFALRCEGSASRLCPQCSLRRIWQVEPEALALVASAFVPPELYGGPPSVREEERFAALLRQCSAPCEAAAAVETAIDQRTLHHRRRWAGSSMAELTRWWEQHRASAPGDELAAFLWHAAIDGSAALQPLLRRVIGTIRLRAMRQFAAHADACADSPRGEAHLPR